MTKRQSLVLIPVAFGLAVVFLFQNCASDFNPEVYNGASAGVNSKRLQISASTTTLVANANLTVNPIFWGNTTKLTWKSSLDDAGYRCFTTSSYNNCSFSKFLDCDNSDDDDGTSGEAIAAFAPVTQPTTVTYSITCIGLSETVSDSVAVTWTPPLASDAPVIAMQAQNLNLNLKSPRTQSLIVVVSDATPDLSYQWYKLNGTDFVAVTGATSAVLDLSTAEVDYYKIHQHFSAIKGTYQLRVNRGAAQTISQAATVTYTQSGNVTLMANCNGSKVIGGTRFNYSGSLKKVLDLDSGNFNLNTVALTVTAGSHTCNQSTPIHEGSVRSIINYNANPIATCFSDRSGFGVLGRLDTTTAGIRVAAAEGNGGFMSVATSNLATNGSCAADWALP